MVLFSMNEKPATEKYTKTKYSLSREKMKWQEKQTKKNNTIMEKPQLHRFYGIATWKWTSFREKKMRSAKYWESGARKNLHTRWFRNYLELDGPCGRRQSTLPCSTVLSLLIAAFHFVPRRRSGEKNLIMSLSLVRIDTTHKSHWTCVLFSLWNEMTKPRCRRTLSRTQARGLC